MANTRGEEGFLDVAVALEVGYRLGRSGRDTRMPAIASDGTNLARKTLSLQNQRSPFAVSIRVRS